MTLFIALLLLKQMDLMNWWTVPLVVIIWIYHVEFHNSEK